MRIQNTVLAVMAFSAFSFSAYAEDIHSLADIPSNYQGVAGDFMSRTPAKLTIKSFKDVGHREGLLGMATVYATDASLDLGSRAMKITQIELNNGELLLQTDDELEPYIIATVRYDESTKTYNLGELPRLGVRRFMLHGQMDHR